MRTVNKLIELFMSERSGNDSTSILIKITIVHRQQRAATYRKLELKSSSQIKISNTNEEKLNDNERISELASLGKES